MTSDHNTPRYKPYTPFLILLTGWALIGASPVVTSLLAEAGVIPHQPVGLQLLAAVFWTGAVSLGTSFIYVLRLAETGLTESQVSIVGCLGIVITLGLASMMFALYAMGV